MFLCFGYFFPEITLGDGPKNSRIRVKVYNLKLSFKTGLHLAGGHISPKFIVNQSIDNFIADGFQALVRSRKVKTGLNQQLKGDEWTLIV